MPATIPTAPAQPRTIVDDLADALKQLNRSERGHRAAVAFRRFLDANDGSAMSLDSENWRAIETLARACRIFGAWNVRDLLPYQ